jgi:hypothetical protein
MSAIPQEVLDSILFKSLSEANDVLSDHNIKIAEYDQIMDAGKLVEQKLTIVDI